MNEKTDNIQNTCWCPAAPGELSKRYPIPGPAKISGVYPTIEIRPTAVPVRTIGISPFSITAKYSERAAYTPVATINIDVKNKSVAEAVMIPDANNMAPKNEIIKLINNQKVVCVRSANTPMATPITGLMKSKKVPTCADFTWS